MRYLWIVLWSITIVLFLFVAIPSYLIIKEVEKSNKENKTLENVIYIKMKNSIMKNESGLEFVNISSEKYRTYEWDNGYKITITEPTHLNVSKSGGHRVLDKSGKSHYIQSGWKHLYWEVFDGQANFVK